MVLGPLADEAWEWGWGVQRASAPRARECGGVPDRQQTESFAPRRWLSWPATSPSSSPTQPAAMMNGDLPSDAPAAAANRVSFSSRFELPGTREIKGIFGRLANQIKGFHLPRGPSAQSRGGHGKLCGSGSWRSLW